MKKYGCYFTALMGATALTPQMALAQDITSESDESHATDTGLARPIHEATASCCSDGDVAVPD